MATTTPMRVPKVRLPAASTGRLGCACEGGPRCRAPVGCAAVCRGGGCRGGGGGGDARSCSSTTSGRLRSGSWCRRCSWWAGPRLGLATRTTGTLLFARWLASTWSRLNVVGRCQEVVVGLSLVSISEDLISLNYVINASINTVVVIGMSLPDPTPIGLLDLFKRGSLTDAKHLVVISFCRGHDSRPCRYRVVKVSQFYQNTSFVATVDV